MRLSRWLPKVRALFLPRASTPPRTGRRGQRPQLESLESRLTPVVSSMGNLDTLLNPTRVENVTPVNDTVFFTANGLGYSTDVELWKSDGSQAGTVMLKEIHPEQPGWAPRDLTNVNGTLFFVVSDNRTSQELWKSDGTAAGTVLVKTFEIIPNTNGGRLSNLTNVNGTLFFKGYDSVHGEELWRSDGTEAGTVLVKDIIPGSSDALSQFPFLTNVNGTLFFRARDAVHGEELWKSDGTEAGTVLVRDIRPGTDDSSPFSMAEFNGILYFGVNKPSGQFGTELWRSDGTEAGTVLLKDVSTPSRWTNVNGTLFFTAFDSAHQNELWKTDGTTEGTVLVKDIWVGGDAGPTFLTNVNGTLYFRADDGVNGRELWKSDGTEAGTVLVKDVWVGVAGSEPANLADVNGTLFFAATTSLGTELWKSDGTAAGTVLVRDIRASGDSSPASLVNLTGTLLFTADDGVNGRDLWKSDGTEAGTALVKDLPNGDQGSEPRNLTDVNGTLFFAAHTAHIPSGAAPPYKLWKSDGTAAGTVLVHDGPVGNSSVNVNGTYFFTAFTGGVGVTLWKSDGTEGGTVRVAGPFATQPSNLTNLNGTLVFTVNDGVNGSELWKSDGTEAGTVLLKDIRAGSSSSSPNLLTTVNGTLFFVADNGVHGRELWKSDGTADGTVLVRDIAAGTAASAATSLTNVNGTLYFTANDGVNGAELWKSDGTQAGTVLVKDIRPGTSGTAPTSLTNVNGTLFFVADDGVNGAELWRSDGTAAGTVLVMDVAPGSGASTPAHLANVNGTLYFTANDGVNGAELWKSDGTDAGTVLVMDVRPGSAGSDPRNLTNFNGKLFFDADDGVHGRELWSSKVDTLLVENLFPGIGGAGVQFLTVSGNNLFFAANDGPTGLELWRYTDTPPTTTGIPNVSVQEDAASTALDLRAYFNDVEDGAARLTYSVLSVGNPALFAAVTVNDATDELTIDYAENANGVSTMTIQAADSGGNTVTTTFTVTVEAVNDPPVAVADSATTPAGAAVTVTVLANDSDVDGDSLSVTAVTQGANGTVAINANGTVTYTPNPGFSGTDGFTYTAGDGNGGTASATVAITVSPASAVELRYDFGTATSPLAAGYTRVSEQTTYTAARGHGWLSGQVQSRDRGTGDARQRDFNFTTDGTFVADLPNGSYTVTVLLGDAASGHDQMALSFEGTQVDTVSVPGGSWVTRSYAVTVSDGQLTFRLRDLGGADANAVVNSIDVVPGSPALRVVSSAPANQGPGPIDRFTLTFSAAVQAGSFTLADVVSLTGPAGAITPSAVNAISPTAYEVTFPSQSAAGTYSMVVGPNVLDQGGTAMDQNSNGTPGETPADQYTATFTIPAPGVRKYDFGTATSPVASGYTAVTPATRYTAALGHGWLSGAVDARERNAGDARQRDFNFTADGTFVVDLANGTYDVTLLMGDAETAHDQMAVSFEGAQVDVVTSPSGGWVTRTYSVTVADGQLTFRLRDLGGGDANAVVNSIDIAPGVPSFRVSSSTPSGEVPGPVDRVTLTFSAAVQAGTFTLADVVSLTGPNGAIAATAVNAISPTVYEVTFPSQSAAGAYTLVVGPNILDTSGGQLDQNGNGTAGEVPGDQFTATFALQSTARDKFDFGTSTSPLATGYRRVTEATTYTQAQGFGWVAGQIASRDRGTGNDLQRDFNFTTDGTFVVDVANGTYNVTLVMGDAQAPHDQMAVSFEGAQVDVVTSPNGGWVTRTYSVTVADGQLTFRLRDLGGGDANAVINSLEITAAG